MFIICALNWINIDLFLYMHSANILVNLKLFRENIVYEVSIATLLLRLKNSFV